MSLGPFPGSAALSLKRVRNLHEPRPARPLQVSGGILEPVVLVAHEEDGLPVELVGEEGRAGEGAALGVDGEGVEARIALDVEVLADQPQEGAGGEVVGELQALDLGGEETAPQSSSGVDVQPLAVGVEVERQVVGGLQGAEEGEVSPLADPGVGEVDRVAQGEIAADAREAAAGIDLEI